jgi:hypothetical protein
MQMRLLFLTIASNSSQNAQDTIQIFISPFPWKFILLSLSYITGGEFSNRHFLVEMFA